MKALLESFWMTINSVSWTMFKQGWANTERTLSDRVFGAWDHGLKGLRAREHD